LEGWNTLHKDTRIITKEHGITSIKNVYQGTHVDTPYGWRTVSKQLNHFPVLYFFYLTFTNGSRLAGSRFIILTKKDKSVCQLVNIKVGDFIKIKGGYTQVKTFLMVKDEIPMVFLDVFSRGNEFYLSNGILLCHRENL